VEGQALPTVTCNIFVAYDRDQACLRLPGIAAKPWMVMLHGGRKK